MSEATATHHSGVPGATRPAVTFSGSELCRMFGLSRWTLKVWLRDGWVVPLVKGTSGSGNGARFALWQSFGIACIAGCLKDAQHRNTYAGKTTVMQTMAAVANLDDALLMPIETHDLHTEEFWAALKGTTLPQELPEQACENARRLMRAIYERAAVMGRSRTARRAPGDRL